MDEITAPPFLPSPGCVNTKGVCFREELNPDFKIKCINRGMQTSTHPLPSSLSQIHQNSEERKLPQICRREELKKTSDTSLSGGPKLYRRAIRRRLFGKAVCSVLGDLGICLEGTFVSQVWAVTSYVCSGWRWWGCPLLQKAGTSPPPEVGPKGEHNGPVLKATDSPRYSFI